MELYEATEDPELKKVLFGAIEAYKRDFKTNSAKLNKCVVWAAEEILSKTDKAIGQNTLKAIALDFSIEKLAGEFSRTKHVDLIHFHNEASLTVDLNKNSSFKQRGGLSESLERLYNLFLGMFTGKNKFETQVNNNQEQINYSFKIK
ncbi:hypothetical protein ACNVED_09345 [Legionella sp. D16C41]|uniref:hypothetical protein n=1 Tax=Legionella sp. D16C41 TaxID=3402688 RepID=UPI003AF5D8A4